METAARDAWLESHKNITEARISLSHAAMMWRLNRDGEKLIEQCDRLHDMEQEHYKRLDAYLAESKASR